MNESRKLDAIKVKENGRVDYGDLDELAASIEQKGLINPLVVDKEDNLIAGHRRYKAILAINRKRKGDLPKIVEVPVIVIDGTDHNDKEVQLIENLQRKDLDVIEEGHSFKDYLDATGHGAEHLAAKIGKPVAYIKRRLALTSLDAKVVEALRAGKITAGHAFLLARYDVKQQTEQLKNIVSNETSVTSMKSDIRYGHGNTCQLKDALFDQNTGKDGEGKGNTGCSTCRFNGCTQFVLSEFGAASKGVCLSPTCFKAKTSAWLQVEIDRLKKDGITVLSAKQMETSASGGLKELYYYHDNYKHALASLKKLPDVYAVGFKTDYSGKLEKKIYQLKNDPTLNTKSGKAKPVTEKAVAANRKERLEAKVNEFKFNFITEVCPKILVPGSKNAKAITVLRLIASLGYNMGDSEVKEVRKILGTSTPESYSKKFVEEIFKVSEDKLDKCIAILACVQLHQMRLDTVQIVAENLKLDYSKQFVMSEEYAKMYTKDQLTALAAEVGIKLDAVKTGEMVTEITKKWPKGKVPKALA